jgi:hypothetical protein
MTHKIASMSLWLRLAFIAIMLTTAGTAGPAFAAEPPVKQTIVSHIGHQADKTTGGSVCTIESKDECQPATTDTGPVGFSTADSVAVAPTKDLYVADDANNRVEELAANGEFVLMFGAKVNKNGGDVCTKAEEAECQAGESGGGVGQFAGPHDVAIDPSSGNVYVLDLANWRIDEFMADGEFVLMFGSKVNKKGGNICTKAEEKECQSGTQSPLGSIEAGAFKFIGTAIAGNLLAVGPGGVLYVADEHRVQEFNRNGEPVGELRAPLEDISAKPEDAVVALAVDAAGDVFLVYSVGSVTHTIHVFAPSGKEVGKFEIMPQEPEVEVEVRQIALDGLGRLAVADRERYGSTNKFRGTLYEVTPSGIRALSDFRSDFQILGEMVGGYGLAFDGVDLYEVGQNEVVRLRSVPVAEVTTGKASCQAGPVDDTDATFDCEAQGNVNPFEVPETEAWFEWGATRRLGAVTAAQLLCASSCGGVSLPVSAHIEGLLPNEAFYYRLAAYDRNSRPPESALLADAATVRTPLTPPRIVGELGASFVHPTSAVMSGGVNPENASTAYEFQYAPASECPSFEGVCNGVLQTPVVESALYGKVHTMGEATGLKPDTTYLYRLVASNDAGKAVDEAGASQLPEARFTTEPARKVSAVTGGAGGVGTTGATISGVIDSGGEAATYAFELGIYNGSDTRYGIVFSDSASPSLAPVEEMVGLAGLQPGTTYAYRIEVLTGFGQAYGEPHTFTTSGLPSVLSVPVALPLLPVPAIHIPAVNKASVRSAKCAHGIRPNAHGRCVAPRRKRSAHARRKAHRSASKAGSTRGVRERGTGRTHR